MVASRVSRRDLLKASAVSVAAMGVTSRIYAAGSDTIRIGLIGCGGQGTRDLVSCVKSSPGVEIVAMGDLFEDRLKESIDKLGNPAPVGSGVSTDPGAPNYISETGMGWFPGYAIDVETGERLNIVYGESSFLTGDSGADMAWNPSTREGSKLYQAYNRLNPGYTDVFFGGKHFVYIMGHNRTQAGKKDVNHWKLSWRYMHRRGVGRKSPSEMSSL